MILTVSELARLAQLPPDDPTGLSVVPSPDLKALSEKGGASLDLRLGRWFLTLRQSSTSELRIDVDAEKERQIRLAKSYFVPFGEDFVLHPGRFVLGATLEWIKLPNNIAGYVTGKSSLGRRGLIIETAAGIHPGFSGCLTLEFANVGEVPIRIVPGMKICQVFFHRTLGDPAVQKSRFNGNRRPSLGALEPDEILQKLSVFQ